MHDSRFLALIATGAVVAFLAIVALEHAVVPEFAPAHYMISEYANAGGLAGIGGTLALAVWAGSFLALALAGLVAIRAAVRPVRARRFLTASLIVASLGLLIAAACPTQAVRGVLPPDDELTLTGRLHDLGGGIGQVAIFVGAIISLRIPRVTRSFLIATAVVVLVAAILGPLMAVLDLGARGLRQRALVVAACTWELALISQLSRRQPFRSASVGSGSV